MDVKVGKVFGLLKQSNKRISVHQGGTRSGKTYNILLWFISKLLNEENKVLSICRASLPTIKGTVLRDFVEILTNMGYYNENFHNKSDNTYQLGSNLVEFISTDQPQKIRGRKRDYLFINEANELSYEAWLQLAFRTTGKIVLDYNPSMEYHWIYDSVLNRCDVKDSDGNIIEVGNTDFNVTTYKNNIDFLEKDVVAEIERLEKADEQYWKVYGMGERGVWKDAIYTHQKQWLSEQWYEVEEKGEVIYGLDFGWNDPCALIKIYLFNGEAFVEEVFYESKILDSEKLVLRMGAAGVTPFDKVYADHKPEMHQPLKQAGFNIIPANKIKNSVFAGIMKVKATPLFIKTTSENIWKEIRSYKWAQDRDGRSMEEPQDGNDHALDAIRYAIYTHLGRRQRDFSNLYKINRVQRKDRRA